MSPNLVARTSTSITSLGAEVNVPSRSSTPVIISDLGRCNWRLVLLYIRSHPWPFGFLLRRGLILLLAFAVGALIFLDLHAGVNSKLGLLKHLWRPEAKASLGMDKPDPEGLQRFHIKANTWGNQTFQERLKMQVIFFLGKSSTTQDNNIAHVVLESTKYQDIVLGDFIDTYRNLSLKSLSMLYFVRDHVLRNSSRQPLVMKIDDDVLVDPYKLRILSKTLHNNLKVNELACKVQAKSPVNRDKDSKWFVTPEEWPLSRGKYYQKYCDGPAYFFWPGAARGLLSTFESEETPFIWLEDVYITGILAKAGGYKIKNHFKPNVFSKVRNRIAILTHFGRDAIDRAKMSAFNHLMDQRANQLGTTQIIKFDPSNEASVLHGSSILIFLLLFTLS